MNTDTEILDTIVREIAKVAPRQVSVTPATSVTRDLGLDSLAVMNFVLTLEETFDVSIPMDRIAGVETIEDLVATIRSLKKDAPV